MPFKSKAQREHFLQQVKDGKLPQRTFDEWDKNTAKDLPDRVGPAKRIKKVKVIK